MEQPLIELDDLPEKSLDELDWPPLDDYLEEYYTQLGSQGDGLKTYFPKLDKELEGLRGIVIIGGEPGSGKTALAMQIGYETAVDEKPVLIYSFEMPKHQLVTRMFQRVGRIRYRTMQMKPTDLEKGDHDKLIETQQEISKAANRVFVRETKDFFREDNKEGSIKASFNFTEQIQQIRLITKKFGMPPLIIIDSLHELPVEVKSAELKQKIDYIMLNLRYMCDETGATFILISHQSRSGQKDGGLGSFMGSASIEYTVDMACTIAIPVEKDSEGKEKRDPKSTERELTFHKNRYGPKPKALLDFNGQYMDFTFIDML